MSPIKMKLILTVPMFALAGMIFNEFINNSYPATTTSQTVVDWRTPHFTPSNITVSYQPIFNNNFNSGVNKKLRNTFAGTHLIKDTTYFPCNNENPSNFGYNCYLLGENMTFNFDYLNTSTGNASGYVKGLEPSGKVLNPATNTTYTDTSLAYTKSDDDLVYGEVVQDGNLYTQKRLTNNNNLIIDTVSRLYYGTDRIPTYFCSLNNSSPISKVKRYFTLLMFPL